MVAASLAPRVPTSTSTATANTSKERRRLHHEADVIIVGAGILGSALATTLARQGRSVILLEKSLKEPDRIVGELLQPGGVQALKTLGLEECLEGIDAIKVAGYQVIYYGEPVAIPYPEEVLRDWKGGAIEEKRTASTYAARPEGRSFHHGRFVQKLRHAAMAEDNVTVIETTATELVRSGYSGQVLGVECKTRGELDYYFAPLTIACDGYASAFRKQAHPFTPTAKSKFYALELIDCPLPAPEHGHVLLGSGAPVLLYQIGTHETRALVDVPHDTPSASVANGGVKGHIKNTVMPDLPDVVKPCFEAALRKVEAGGPGSALRSMPNSFLPASTAANNMPGLLILGDALNMRHPLTGGGMTVALSDVVLLRGLLAPENVPSLDSPQRISKQMQQFYWSRKNWSAVINILAQALYSLFAADDPQLKTLQMGCFRYFQLGGACLDGPCALLAGIMKQPFVLFYHFFSVALYSIWIFVVEGPGAMPGEKKGKKPQDILPNGPRGSASTVESREKAPNKSSSLPSSLNAALIPYRFIASFGVFWKACVVLFPYIFAELRL